MAHTLEDTDGSGEVVDTASSLQGSAEDLNGGDEIVGEAVVQVSLAIVSSLVLFAPVYNCPRHIG